MVRLPSSFLRVVSLLALYCIRRNLGEKTMKKPGVSVLVPAALIASSLIAGPLFGQTPAASAPKAVAPYTVTVFATGNSTLSAPDSIAVVGNHVFVGYGDGHAPDGSDGKNSQVVEYRIDNGAVVHVYTVPGHNDGLKLDPATGLPWALQNEDGNSNLVIINPATQEQKLYAVGTGLHGGGYDDIVFRGCQVYFSASNPAHNPNTEQAIVTVRLGTTHVDVKEALAGNASATDLTTDATASLNLQDPDSMTLDPLGNIVLDSQADQELVIVTNPTSSAQRALVLPLTYQSPTGVARVEVDDTTFATSDSGYLLVADKTLNAVYAIHKKAFAPGSAYTAADGAHFVGALDMTSGFITPIVTGLTNPGGLVFVDTSGVPSQTGIACASADASSH
jgi:hypothetical protein